MGNGPVEGTRSDEAALGGGAFRGAAGLEGGGMSPAEAGWAGFANVGASFGGGDIFEALWALSGAGKLVAVGVFVFEIRFESSSSPSLNAKVGTGEF